MTEDELIQLLQDKLPEELDEQVIALLRQRIRTSPRVRDYLLAELRLEQDLATHLSPPVNLTVVLGRIEELITQRRQAKLRKLVWSLSAVAVVVAVGVVLTLALSGGGDESQTTSGTSVDSGSAGVGGALGDETGGAVVAGISDSTDSSGHGDRADAGHPQELAPLTWRVFLGPLLERGGLSEAELRRVAEPVGDASLRQRGDSVVVSGRLEVTKPLRAGRALRISGINDQWRLEFWWADQGLILGYHDRTYGAWRIPHGLQNRAKPNLDRMERLLDPSGPAALYCMAPLDVSWQQGRLFFSFGDIVLWTLPAATPPKEVFYEARDRTVQTFQDRQAVRLTAPPSQVEQDTRGAEEVEPSRWTKLSDDGDLRTGDSVRFGRSDKPDRIARAGLTLPPDTPFMVVLRVKSADPGTGVEMYGPGEHAHFPVLFEQREGSRWIVPGWGRDSREWQQSKRRALRVNGPVWVRFIRGWEWPRAEYSADGRTWIPLERGEYYPGGKLEGDISLCAVVDAKRAGTVEIDEVRVRPLNAMRNLASEWLLQEAAKAEFPGAKSFEEALAQIRAARPADAPADQWELAACVYLLDRPGSVYPTRGLARHAFEIAINSGTEIPAVLAALEQSRLMFPDPQNAVSHGDYIEWYDRLARRANVERDYAMLPRIADSFIHLPVGVRSWGLSREWPVPPLTARLILLALRDEQRWEALWTQSLRYQYLSLLIWGRRPSYWHSRWNIPNFAFAGLLAEQARAHLGGDLPSLGGDGGLAEASLAISADRETENALADLATAAEVGQYHQAIQALIAPRRFANELVSFGRDPDLLMPSHALLRRALQETPELQRELSEQFADVGQIRVRRALQEDDAETLESLAAQFHGTDASRQAQWYLARRDLGMGDFFSADDRLSKLADNPPVGLADEIRARLLLARAMIGRTGGPAPSGPVRIGDRTYTPEQLAELVRPIAARNAPGTRVKQTTAATVRPAFGPAGKVAQTALGEVSYTPTTTRARTDPNLLSICSLGKLVIVASYKQVQAIDPNAKRVVWSYGKTEKEAPNAPYTPVRALVIGDLVYVRWPEKEGSRLLCLDANGRKKWQRTYGRSVTGDPILFDGWIYMLSLSQRQGARVSLQLNRISPETGELTLQRKLIDVNGDRDLDRGGRWVASETCFVGYYGDALLCCDPSGEVLWVRRLAGLPALDPYRRQVQPTPVLAGNRVYLPAGLTGHVTCIDIASGAVVWQTLEPEAERLVCPPGGPVVCLGPGGALALDAGTGKPIWRRADLDVLVPAADNTLLAVWSRPTWDDKEPVRREYLWLDASTGQIRSRVLPDENAPAGKPMLLTVCGGRVLCLIEADRDKAARAVVLQLTPK